ncbi:MAG: hypothetical protein SFX73_05185 [Kofleriaceae bacterium]|nr:hypothetical protein [Kofleriaceae bacterium]
MPTDAPAPHAEGALWPPPDIAQLLAAIESGLASEAGEALDLLAAHALHGGAIYPILVDVLPHLLRVAPRSRARAQLAEMLEQIAATLAERPPGRAGRLLHRALLWWTWRRVPAIGADLSAALDRHHEAAAACRAVLCDHRAAIEQLASVPELRTASAQLLRLAATSTASKRTWA